ncbi:MAG: DUF1598 domain-containing protein [Pirellulales bacterium]|nr:DUF1598 domain-containing protein [Pirellulales bacterium]
MQQRSFSARALGLWRALVLAPLVLVGALREPARAQQFPRVASGGVGGVAINARGILSRADVELSGELREHYAAALARLPADLNKHTPLRKVSLKRLDAEVARSRAAGADLPEEVQFLAGLQDVRYVLIYPDQQDIVLVGYGEAWRLDDRGTFVGVSTGRPVLWLDDLVVALRTARDVQADGISCSIDPSAAGMTRLQQFLASSGELLASDPNAAIIEIEESLGPQRVTVAGVPATSHFARVMVAADFRMKCLAMNFEPSPVKGLGSYLHLASGRGSMMPRWWLEPDYDAILRTADNLAWEIRGARVKTVTEDSSVDDSGQRTSSGRASPDAQRWADQFTRRYDDVSRHIPVFAELSNLMDLAVVAALLTKEDFTAKANCPLLALTGADGLPPLELPAARQVDSRASFFRKGNSWVVSASGGVVINSWGALDKLSPDADGHVAEVREKSRAAPDSSWWWN